MPRCRDRVEEFREQIGDEVMMALKAQGYAQCPAGLPVGALGSEHAADALAAPPWAAHSSIPSPSHRHPVIRHALVPPQKLTHPKDSEAPRKASPREDAPD
eukprot:Skav210963  [mRNA]  locus=scaffold2129:45023:47021:+ [translate_table: standard]